MEREYFRFQIDAVQDLRVGDVGFYVIAGKVGGLVSLGQALIDFVNLVRGWESEQAWFSHAFIVIRTGFDGGGPWADIIEAMPRGARIVRLRGSDRMSPGYGFVRLPLTPHQKDVIAALAPTLEGTPYSFLDYLSIALLHLGLPRKLTAGRVRDSGHMICSQLVDYLLCRAEFHLFSDGRVSQDVTPGVLFRKAGAFGEATWW